MHAQYGLMIVITIQVEQRFPSAIDLGFVMSLKWTTSGVTLRETNIAPQNGWLEY